MAQNWPELLKVGQKGSKSIEMCQNWTKTSKSLVEKREIETEKNLKFWIYLKSRTNLEIFVRKSKDCKSYDHHHPLIRFSALVIFLSASDGKDTEQTPSFTPKMKGKLSLCTANKSDISVCATHDWLNFFAWRTGFSISNHFL